MCQRLVALVTLLAGLLLLPGPAWAQGSVGSQGEKEQPLNQLTASTGVVEFGGYRVGERSELVEVTLVNRGRKPVKVASFGLAGDDPGDFAFRSNPAAPVTIPSRGRAVVRLQFRPKNTGQRDAVFQVSYAARGSGPLAVDTVVLIGVGLGAPGDEVRMNAGGAEYVDSLGNRWSPTFGSPGGVSFTSVDPVASTADPALYQDYLEGARLDFDLPLPSGHYEVTLHFVEPVHTNPGERVFSVSAEASWPLQNLDLVTEAGHDVAYQASFDVEVADGSLDLLVDPSVGQAIVSGIEVHAQPFLVASPESAQFGGVPAGQNSQVALTINNLGLVPAHIDSLTFDVDVVGDASPFTVTLDGTPYAGGIADVVHPLSVTIPALSGKIALVEFAPVDETLNWFDLAFGGDFGELRVPVSGLGGHDGHPFLHVVADVEELVVDYDADGSEPLVLDGTQSHTHEPGHALVGYEWTEGGLPIASGPFTSADFAIGTHTIELTIIDDNVPPEEWSLPIDFEVRSADDVPGVLALYYAADASGPAALLDAVPSVADFGEVLGEFALPYTGSIGSTSFTGNVMVRLQGQFLVTQAGTWDFAVLGGSGHRLEIDGVPYAGAQALAVGVHNVEVRWAVATVNDLPLQLFATVDGGLPFEFDAALLTHDQTQLRPVINDMPSSGSVLGGNVIDIVGVGFFPADQVAVNWGGQLLTSVDFTEITPYRITFDSPAGSGQIQVQVQAPAGNSNVRTFTYDDNAPVPVKFKTQTAWPLNEPTCGAWGPDGRFYVGGRYGQLWAVTFDDDYNVVQVDAYDGVAATAESTILGIAFSPFETSGTIQLYVAHNELFAQGGSSFTGPSPYPGKVSVLTAPDFDNPTPLITQLPVSNHDHGINGLQFDNNGDLLICSGGNTNAGVIHPNMGDLPESPLTGAILKAELSKPGFNGAVTYVETDTGLPNDDQVFGGDVDVAPGVDVHVHASGLRNTFDLVFTTSGRVYATDNGPNWGFGKRSTGPDTQLNDPQTPDEVCLIERHNYYGHPNRNRGRYDFRQNIWYGQTEPTELGVFAQLIESEPSSTNGITEYRAETFGGQMRGEVLVQKWLGYVNRLKLGSNGRTVTDTIQITTWTGALDVETAPGGALIGLDQLGNMLRVLVPVDQGVDGLTPYDITPWRAPSTGGARFEIGGENFGTLVDTSVTIGGFPAALVSVTSRRIVGIVPPNALANTELVDVVVHVAGETATLEDAFRWLGPVGTEPGRWEIGPGLPQPLGEVAAGWIGGHLYVVGEGVANTFALDILARTWDDTLAPRPFPGHHHSAETVDGLLYLIGGLDLGSEGKVQIYDPVADSWSAGADMPWAAGSVQTCVIDGKIYAAGGIVANATVDNCAVYDPVLDAWTNLASMAPNKGRNHAAAATDGQRFFIFGGRGKGSGSGNFVANGFDDVQIYDPVTDTWEASFDVGSTLAPLPQFRGGMGKAVYYDGEFYVFGGETFNGPGATADDVYDRVDVYDPVANTWRLEAMMPTARHGIYPVLIESRMFLAGGGTKSGFSSSNKLEIFTRQ